MASGFKNTTRMRSGFNFGQNSGFTASSGRVQNISYTRKTPKPRAKFAEGGQIDGALHGPTPESALATEAGPKVGLRPGFTRGGYAPKYAKGGQIPAHKVAATEAKKVVAKHVSTPAPKGHKGLKGC